MHVDILDPLTGARVPLPENVQLSFGEGFERITVRVREGHVELAGDGRLVVEPRASNLVWISLKKDLV